MDQIDCLFADRIQRKTKINKLFSCQVIFIQAKVFLILSKFERSVSRIGLIALNIVLMVPTIPNKAFSMTFGGRIIWACHVYCLEEVIEWSVNLSIAFLFIGIITYSEYLFLVTVLTSKFFSGIEHFIIF